MKELKGRKIFGGKARGEVLKSGEGISFYGGTNPETGTVIEKGHPLEGKSFKGKVLVFPKGKGSTVGSYALYMAKKKGVAPAAIINGETDPIVAVGAIISEIPCMDKVDLRGLENGMTVEVDSEKEKVKIK